jgi:hypothetical protein
MYLLLHASVVEENGFEAQDGKDDGACVERSEGVGNLTANRTVFALLKITYEI